MTSIRIPLAEPIQGAKGPVETLVLRQPRWNDIMPVGSPYTIHQTPDGARFMVENHGAIEHYARECLVEPDDARLLEQIGLHDTMQVREAVLDFFTPGSGTTRKPPTPSPEPSSSDASSEPITSET
nr:hypothetical protein NG677_04210 [Methylobacterium sp. OTU13CASTA1]